MAARYAACCAAEPQRASALATAIGESSATARPMSPCARSSATSTCVMVEVSEAAPPSVSGTANCARPSSANLPAKVGGRTAVDVRARGRWTQHLACEALRHVADHRCSSLSERSNRSLVFGRGQALGVTEARAPPSRFGASRSLRGSLRAWCDTRPVSPARTDPAFAAVRCRRFCSTQRGLVRSDCGSCCLGGGARALEQRRARQAKQLRLLSKYRLVVLAAEQIARDAVHGDAG